jgi:iron(III) transport system ATP-binding protein
MDFGAALRGDGAGWRMSGPAELYVDGIRKAFNGAAVLRGVSLSVPAGKLVAILGASGSGKTTLLRLICGFERSDAGTITLAGRTLSGPGLHLPIERRQIGYVAQEGALFPHLSVAENVLFGLKRQDRRDSRRAAALLERVGLSTSYADRGPHQLSGGEQQRVALARALAPGPRLVLLDEPFSALDAALRVETRLAVAASLAASGATAVLVTHDQSEALSLGDQVGVLRNGVLVQMDRPEALYRHPVDLELARFVGEAVVLRGEARGGTAACCLGDLPLLDQMTGVVDLMIRPEQLRLGQRGPPARVEAVRFYGPDAAVSLRLPDGTVITARVPGYAVPSVGDRVPVEVAGPVIAFRNE